MNNKDNGFDQECRPRPALLLLLLLSDTTLDPETLVMSENCFENQPGGRNGNSHEEFVRCQRPGVAWGVGCHPRCQQYQA